MSERLRRLQTDAAVRHRTALNFGDCFVYSLAERTGFPVLSTGDDFASTDLDVLRASSPGPARGPDR